MPANPDRRIDLEFVKAKLSKIARQPHMEIEADDPVDALGLIAAALLLLLEREGTCACGQVER